MPDRPIEPPSMIACCAAEAMGTFALVFAGAGAIVVNHITGGAVTHPGIAITFGLVVMAVIYAIGAVSGAHINPAVTIGFWASGRFPGVKVGPYVGAQIAGAFIAAAMLRMLFPDSPTLGETLPAGPWHQSFLLEIILTWFLIFVILCVAMGSKEQGLMAGIAIGGTIGLEAMFAGPISGASMNPARSLGPAVVAWNITDVWIYLLAPLIGAIAAVPCWRIIRRRQPAVAGAQEGPDV